MRTTTTITLNRSADEVRNILGELLVRKGYEFKKYKKEMVWRLGNGWLTAPQIFNFRLEQDKLHIEGWVPFAILPGCFIGESGLNSGFGIIVKVPMRNVLREIINTFKAEGTEVIGYIPKEK